MSRREFLQGGSDAPTQVKICGITTAEDAREVVAAGADALGINFWPKSKRYVSMESARTWLPDVPVARVGVFVNATLAGITALVESELIDMVQLHGDETPEFAQALVDRGAVVIKAFGVKDESSLGSLRDFPVEKVLLDAYCPGDYGGSGETFDWDLARKMVVENPDRRVVLAGGLIPDNIAAAVEAVRPAAVDVASGVEFSPGVKDLEKVARLIHRVREA